MAVEPITGAFGQVLGKVAVGPLYTTETRDGYIRYKFNPKHDR